MQYRGVIFDLDGTLIDSIEDLANAMNTVLSNHNLPTHTVPTYKELIGNGIKRLVKESLPKKYQEEGAFDALVTEMYEIYKENCLIKTKPYDGINELLDLLEKKQIKYAILSNKADAFCKSMVADIFSNRKFEMVMGTTDEAFKKPHPRGVFAICEKWNMKPEEVIFLGDSAVDIKTAQNSGTYGVAATWGFKSKEELVTANPDALINHPMEFKDIL
ncbi:HAD family hydrolase [Prolixibacteraceae bacterium JC049]|nr:HAD family hydrolase [Prolixibacteraceae bacterium JC049]